VHRVAAGIVLRHPQVVVAGHDGLPTRQVGEQAQAAVEVVRGADVAANDRRCVAGTDVVGVVLDAVDNCPVLRQEIDVNLGLVESLRGVGILDQDDVVDLPVAIRGELAIAPPTICSCSGAASADEPPSVAAPPSEDPPTLTVWVTTFVSPHAAARTTMPTVSVSRDTTRIPMLPSRVLPCRRQPNPRGRRPATHTERDAASLSAQ